MFNVQTGVIESSVCSITEEFLNGEFFIHELAVKTFNQIDLTDSAGYMDTVNLVKRIINTAVRYEYKDILFYETEEVLTVKQKAVLVRLSGMSYKNRIVVVNNEIVHYPKGALTINSEKDVRLYVNRALKTLHKKAVKEKIKDAFSFKNLFKLPEAFKQKKKHEELDEEIDLPMVIRRRPQIIAE